MELFSVSVVEEDIEGLEDEKNGVGLISVPRPTCYAANRSWKLDILLLIKKAFAKFHA